MFSALDTVKRMINRRDFLKLNGLLALLPLTVKSQVTDEGKAANLPKGQIRVWQGAADAHSTIISILAPRESYLYFEINSGNKFLSSFAKDKIDFQYGEYVLYQLSLNNLELKTEYTLAIFDKTYDKSYHRKFRTLDLNKENAKIALLSCANYKKADPQETMCDRLVQSQADVIFFLGDLVYANSSLNTLLGTAATPEEAYQAYCKTILEIDLYKADVLIPIFGIHDDHDLGKNNSDDSIKNKEIMLKMFRSFFPVDTRIGEVQIGPGNSFAIECFGMLAVFFDTRSFKNKKKDHYLGPEQLNWIKKILFQNQMPVMLISTQQFWSYRFLAESYQGTSQVEFQQLIDYIKSLKQNIFFISGDVHYSQLQQVPYELLKAQTFEITSSAFFSSSARSFGKRSVEEGQIFYYGHPNFITLEQIQISDNDMSMTVCCHTEEQTNQFVEKIQIKK